MLKTRNGNRYRPPADGLRDRRRAVRARAEIRDRISRADARAQISAAMIGEYA